MMRRYVLGLLIGLLGCVFVAHGQEATERFIPIGQSPGLSGRYTSIGQIQSVDSRSRTLTVVADGRTYSVGVTERTRIWIDRSPFKLTALTGTVEDLQPGRKVEVKYEDEGERRFADWIKVQPAVP